MTQQFLDRTQIGARAQHVGGKGVTESVGGDLFHGGEFKDVAINNASHAATGEPSATGIEKCGPVMAARGQSRDI